MGLPSSTPAVDYEALAAQCWRSPADFCRIYLPNWFPTKMPWVHRGILALRTGKTDFLLDFGVEMWRDGPAEWTVKDLEKILTNFLDEETGEPLFAVEEVEGTLRVVASVKPNIGIIMPRGFSKTTLMNSANLMDIVYHNENFFLYTSESGGHAQRQLGTIKAELSDGSENELLRATFGQFEPGRQDARKWTEEYIETLTGVSVGAVGRGGQIRGFSKGARRPGIITYDDLEDEESVASPIQRKKDTNWFFGTAMPSVRRLPTPGRNFIIGTLLHDDAILNKVIVSPEFTAVRFGAIDRQGDPLWALMMNLEQIEAKKLAMARVGELASFYLEYMSEARTDEVRIFPESKLVYIHKGAELFVGLSLAMDPAISEESTADFCAFAVTGIERGGCKHVLDFYAEQGMDPAAQIDKYFEMAFRSMLSVPPENRKYGIEAIGYQRSLIHLVKSQQFLYTKVRGYDAHFEIIPIFHGKTGKIARIKGMLKPLVHSGYLTFEERWPELHSQLVEFPAGKRDAPDVVAMSISLLDPFAMLNLDPDFKAEESSAPPLHLVLGGSFRGAP